MSRYVVVVSLLLALGPVGAADTGVQVGQILEQQRDIRRESETATGEYSRFGYDVRASLHAAQDRIFQLLAGVKDVRQLPPEQQAELFNALETVKAVLADNEADRQVCRREHKLGTTLRQTRCATVAERAKAREESRQWHGDTSICGQRSTGISCGIDAAGRLGP